jgi:hypothetical protein
LHYYGKVKADAGKVDEHGCDTDISCSDCQTANFKGEGDEADRGEKSGCDDGHADDVDPLVPK